MDIKESRHRCKLTQVQAAQYVGMPLRTYQMYETCPEKVGTLKYNYILDKLNQYIRIDEEHGLLTLPEIQSICQEVFQEIPVRYCYLFGSYAKSTATETSDVDLLVGTSLTGFRYFGLVDQLKEKLHKKVDILDTRQLLNNEELLDEVLSEGIKIYG